LPSGGGGARWRSAGFVSCTSWTRCCDRPRDNLAVIRAALLSDGATCRWRRDPRRRGDRALLEPAAARVVVGTAH